MSLLSTRHTRRTLLSSLPITARRTPIKSQFMLVIALLFSFLLSGTFAATEYTLAVEYYGDAFASREASDKTVFSFLFDQTVCRDSQSGNSESEEETETDYPKGVSYPSRRNVRDYPLDLYVSSTLSECPIKTPPTPGLILSRNTAIPDGSGIDEVVPYGFSSYKEENARWAMRSELPLSNLLHAEIIGAGNDGSFSMEFWVAFEVWKSYATEPVENCDFFTLMEISSPDPAQRDYLWIGGIRYNDNRIYFSLQGSIEVSGTTYNIGPMAIENVDVDNLFAFQARDGENIHVVFRVDNFGNVSAFINNKQVKPFDGPEGAGEEGTSRLFSMVYSSNHFLRFLSSHGRTFVPSVAIDSTSYKCTAELQGPSKLMLAQLYNTVLNEKEIETNFKAGLPIPLPQFADLQELNTIAYEDSPQDLTALISSRLDGDPDQVVYHVVQQPAYGSIKYQNASDTSGCPFGGIVYTADKDVSSGVLDCSNRFHAVDSFEVIPVSKSCTQDCNIKPECVIGAPLTVKVCVNEVRDAFNFEKPKAIESHSHQTILTLTIPDVDVSRRAIDFTLGEASYSSVAEIGECGSGETFPDAKVEATYAREFELCATAVIAPEFWITYNYKLHDPIVTYFSFRIQETGGVGDVFERIQEISLNNPVTVCGQTAERRPECEIQYALDIRKSFEIAIPALHDSTREIDYISILSLPTKGIEFEGLVSEGGDGSAPFRVDIARAENGVFYSTPIVFKVSGFQEGARIEYQAILNSIPNAYPKSFVGEMKFVYPGGPVVGLARRSSNDTTNNNSTTLDEIDFTNGPETNCLRTWTNDNLDIFINDTDISSIEVESTEVLFFLPTLCGKGLVSGCRITGTGWEITAALKEIECTLLPKGFALGEQIKRTIKIGLPVLKLSGSEAVESFEHHEIVVKGGEVLDIGEILRVCALLTSTACIFAALYVMLSKYNYTIAMLILGSTKEQDEYYRSLEHSRHVGLTDRLWCKMCQSNGTAEEPNDERQSQVDSNLDQDGDADESAAYVTTESSDASQLRKKKKKLGEYDDSVTWREARMNDVRTSQDRRSRKKNSNENNDGPPGHVNDWEKRIDRMNGEVYYYNIITHETRDTLPDNLDKSKRESIDL